MAAEMQKKPGGSHRAFFNGYNGMESMKKNCQTPLDLDK
jgi:hypothetical protein